jgi:hypothetical protein
MERGASCTEWKCSCTDTSASGLMATTGGWSG